MVTYPSTHGVFEEAIRDICAIIHASGGQVLWTGANMNAQVGLTSPAAIGADVCHLNLHKTFCDSAWRRRAGVGADLRWRRICPLPAEPSAASGCRPAHGGGAGGLRPLRIGDDPAHPLRLYSPDGGGGAEAASEVAILSANHIARRLAPHYPILYRGKGGRVAHGMHPGLPPFQAEAGITVEDIAKRLQDFGFHAPTMSWPVAGTLMVEPTESEPLGRDRARFIAAMIAIREEIAPSPRGGSIAPTTR